MADKKETLKPKERVKYKFGQHDIDLTNYIHNLGTNVKSYLNSKNWNEGLRLEFMNAYNKYLTGLQELLANNTNRFTTNDFGSIIDSTGALSNTDNDDIDQVGSEYYYDNKGNRITTNDFNLLGKRKLKKYNTFSANREVATYFNAIGDALKDMETPEEKAQDAFDLSKHGFSADWTKTNNPAGGDFVYNPYWEMDEVNGETGVRGTTNRATYLKGLIENYINNIGEYDFSSSPFKTRDAYILRLQEAADGLANGYNSEDTIALNRAGISGDFLNKFFATGAEEAPIKKSELELQAIEAEKRLKLRLKDDENRKIIEVEAEDQYNRERNTYFDDYLRLHPFESSVLGTTLAPNYSLDKMNTIAANKFKADKTNLASMQHAIKSYINFPQLYSSIRGKLTLSADGRDVTLAHIANNLDWMYNSGILMDPKYLNELGKSILPDGYYVLPGSEDYQNWSYLAYNPDTRLYLEQSMLLNEELRKRMAYTEYDKRNKAKQITPKLENGGVLMFQGGGLAKWVEENLKAKENAVKNDRTIEELEKYENDSKLLWSDADRWRLGAIAGDIASLIASMTGVGSVASAAIGAASTAANLAADMKEGMGFWESLGNNAVSYGLDALSVLPFAKAAKVPRMVKAIAGFTPKLMAGISTVLGLANGEEILKSLKKVKDGESLTVGDWKNISLGLQIVLGGGAAFNRARVANKRLNAAKTDSEYVLTNLGTVKLSAKQMKKLRTANTLEEQNKVLKKLGVTLEGKKEGKFFWNRRTSDKAVDIPENFVYDLSKPVTLHSGDLQYQYKFGPGEKLLGGVNLDIKFPKLRNVYNQVFHPLAVRRTNLRKGSQQPSMRREGGTLNLVKVRKFKYAGKFATLTDPAVTSVIKPFQESSDNKLFFSNINPTIAYGLPRAMYDDMMNRRNTDLAKESVVPLLQKPFYVHRYNRSDLDAEMQGERNYANFKRLASIPITSDGYLQMAALFQSEVLGQEARTAGKERSNLVQRLYDELALLLEKENAANRYEKEMSNMFQLWNADKTKNAFEQAYLYKKANIRDVLGQLLEYDAKVKLKENKALEDNFAKSDIHNAIIYTPNNYGANLTPNELTVWNKVLSGTDPSSLTSPGEFNSYKLALLKVSRAENDQLRLYYNVPYTRWSGKTPSIPWTPTMSKAISAKNGAKITVAGIEAKTADAERFLKQIKEYLDRNEKVIDRLSKSLLGLIKASTIK